MPAAGVLDQGRTSFRQRSWAAAFAELSAADGESSLEPADLELLATAAILIGRDDDGAHFLVRAHHQWLSRSDLPGAARCAIWLAIHLSLRGETAKGGGWLARAHHLLDEGQHDCAERGYLLVLAGLESLGEGGAASAQATFGRAVEFGTRFGDRDLTTLAMLGIGQSLIQIGSATEATAVLDEVMIAVTAGEVSPVVVGIVTCAVIEACLEVFDLHRAQEWTAALTHWCASQPDLVPYRGQCLVHRSQIMQLHGAWPDALDAAKDACERLAGAGQPAAGAAFYQQAELHRLRGEFTMAEQAYQRARRWIRDPQPGHALLMLMQGQGDAAAAAIRRAVDEADERVQRSRLLGAYVEIMLTTGDVRAARVGADELREIANKIGGPWLAAVAAQAAGAVLIAEEDPRAAMSDLRAAWTAWQELDVPYDAARVRVLMGLACRGLGDEHSAEMELDAGRWVFQQLGALPDLVRVEALSRKDAAAATGGLTARETEVLRLVATGKTNRAVAADLFLSEKTVARHLSNIFTKLGLSSRSGATAYAYEHGLVQRD